MDKLPMQLDYASPSGVKPSELPAWVIIFMVILAFMAIVAIALIAGIVLWVDK